VDWNCAPTVIGSLPCTDPAKAVDLILEKLVAVPTWPQLPQVGFQENMYVQFMAGLPGVQVDNDKKKIRVNLADYDPEAIYTRILEDDADLFAFPQYGFSGFHEFMSRELPPSVRALKGQMTGPVSLGLQVTDLDDKPVIYDEAYAEIIRKSLNLMARWQERELHKKCPETVLFIDEPYLSIIGTPFASVSQADVTSWIAEVTTGLEGMTGIHCCANTDWPFVMSMGIDVLSFDAYDYGYTISLYPEEVDRFLRSGGSLAWGVVPNHEEPFLLETASSLADRVEGLMASLVNKGLDQDLLLRRSLLTPQCGLGGLDVKVGERVLDLLVETSDELCSRHSLE